MDTESLWLCSRNTSVPEVGLLLGLDLDKTLAKPTEDHFLPPFLLFCLRVQFQLLPQIRPPN